MDIFDYYDVIYDRIRNTEYQCPIIQTIIKEHDFYCRCVQCKTSMSHAGLIKWFNQTPHNGIKSCPYCQTQWTNWKIYINSNCEIIKLEDSLEDQSNQSSHEDSIETNDTEFSEISSQTNKRKRILGGFGAITKN